LQLTQTNARLAAENEYLRKKVVDLEADIARITEVASALNAPRPSRPMPQWQIDRAEAMAAARRLAMASHVTVKV
jgi:hypothetical protein